MKNETIDWIIELCPEIQEWQAAMIAQHVQDLVKAERAACITAIKQIGQHNLITLCVEAIRTRGEQ